MSGACPYAASEMTPCAIKDGPVAWAESDRGIICVGCEHSPKFLRLPPPPEPAEEATAP